MAKLNEPKWKNDLIKIIWKQARKTGQVTGISGLLTPGFEDLVSRIRNSCDLCGRPRKILRKDPKGVELEPYQCCWVDTFHADYCPHLCLDCHKRLQRERPHATISV